MPIFDKPEEFSGKSIFNSSVHNDSLKWRLIIDNPTGTDGELNMATDRALLSASEESLVLEPTLRIYSWSEPTVSIGYGQNAEDFVFENLKTVKRVTGGRALVHGNDLSYAFVCSKEAFKKFGTNLNETYEALSKALAFALEGIGIETSLSGKTDFNNKEVPKQRNACFAMVSTFEHRVKTLGGYKKISGNAQRRLKNSFIQHGSIMLGSNDLIDTQVFGKDFSRWGTDASAETGKSPEELKSLLTKSIAEGFKKQFGIEFTAGSYTELEEKLRCNVTDKFCLSALASNTITAEEACC